MLRIKPLLDKDLEKQNRKIFLITLSNKIPPSLTCTIQTNAQVATEHLE